MKIINLLKDKNFYILNIFTIIFYVVLSLLLELNINNSILYSTTDAKEYLDVANWFVGGEATYGLSIRPFLYPLVIMVTTSIGNYGIWIAQILMWLLTINFVFYTIKSFSKNIIFPYIGALIIISNLSLITLTFHALTEIITTFLLSIFCYCIVKKHRTMNKLKFIHSVVLFLTLLTVVKPVFYIPLLFVIFIILPVFIIRNTFNIQKK